MVHAVRSIVPKARVGYALDVAHLGCHTGHLVVTKIREPSDRAREQDADLLTGISEGATIERVTFHSWSPVVKLSNCRSWRRYRALILGRCQQCAWQRKHIFGRVGRRVKTAERD